MPSRLHLPLSHTSVRIIAACADQDRLNAWPSWTCSSLLVVGERVEHATVDGIELERVTLRTRVDKALDLCEWRLASNVDGLNRWQYSVATKLPQDCRRKQVHEDSA